jgi:hypothetical protein
MRTDSLNNNSCSLSSEIELWYSNLSTSVNTATNNNCHDDRIKVLGGSIPLKEDKIFVDHSCDTNRTTLALTPLSASLSAELNSSRESAK